MSFQQTATKTALASANARVPTTELVLQKLQYYKLLFSLEITTFAMSWTTSLKAELLTTLASLRCWKWWDSELGMVLPLLIWSSPSTIYEPSSTFMSVDQRQTVHNGLYILHAVFPFVSEPWARLSRARSPSLPLFSLGIYFPCKVLLPALVCAVLLVHHSYVSAWSCTFSLLAFFTAALTDRGRLRQMSSLTPEDKCAQGLEI